MQIFIRNSWVSNNNLGYKTDFDIDFQHKIDL